MRSPPPPRCSVPIRKTGPRFFVRPAHIARASPVSRTVVGVRSPPLLRGVYFDGAMTRMPYALPLMGHAMHDVTGEGRFTLWFDNPAKGRLLLAGPFNVVASGERITFEPPCPEWVRSVLLSLCAIQISGSRFTRTSQLFLKFADGRELRVEDGPFENWHYSDDSGLSIHGGVGRTA